MELMTRFLLYLFLLGMTLYWLSRWGQRRTASFPVPETPSAPSVSKPNKWFRPKRSPSEVWVQVFETASMDEARVFQARLQEEEVECVLYEQGKKDIHGNALKGVGIAVPKTAMTLAQNLISRLLS